MFRDDRFSTSLPDDLPRQMSAHTDGKLIFYGHAGEKITMSGMTANIAFNPYTFDGYYFLSDAHDSEYNTGADTIQTQLKSLRNPHRHLHREPRDTEL